ncbi:MAG: methylenetetrahydrofolate reductase [Acidimicrobiia bacterium]|nr:methylenetetrahydrofolate reductase [Acidimicrobiia bacterium]
MALSSARNALSLGAWQKQSFRFLLQETKTFVTCVELVTSRGVITERSGRRVMELARALAQHPGIHALSITDNPGGNAMISSDILGTDLISRGQDVIIHLSCKDWNRNALQSRGWQLASAGFNNVLAMSGDYPTDGYRGLATGVFDIDSVALLRMFSDMNAGIAPAHDQGSAHRMEPTHLFLGAVVNNHKRYEREVMPQYFKLAKKIECGAQFIINQIGYDSRKQDELLKYMAFRGFDLPVIANVFVLGATAARYFHSGKIPGCVVTDDLLALSEKQAKSPDKGKRFFLELAAKQCAIAKGLGFRGVYLGGHLKYPDYEQILQLAAGFGERDWKEFAKEIRFGLPDEFYFFEPDPETGLSSTEINRAYLCSKTPEAQEELKRSVPLSYKINRAVHDTVFEEGTTGFAIGKKISETAERSGQGMQRMLHGIEHAIKIVTFDCRDCGDCSLPDIAYLCPESQCAKNQRNGPCGGTRQGKCEVGEKECIWALAYERLKAYGEEGKMLERPVVVKDGKLRGTSAWANAFLKKDHHSKN